MRTKGSHAERIAHAPCELGDRPVGAGRNQIRSELGQRLEDEGSLCETRMGNTERRGLDPAVGVEQQIEIEGTWRVALRLPHATSPLLDEEQCLEKRLGAKPRPDLQHGVQVAALFGPAHRLGLEEPGGRDDPGPRQGVERAPRRKEMGLPIPQVRAQRDEGAMLPCACGHGRLLAACLLPPTGGWLEYRCMSTLLPETHTPIPGPRSCELARRLARVESRNVTCLAPEPPIFWEEARGANVWDVDGNRFVDLGGGFGVAAAGHAHPAVARAVADQSTRLLHAMGDVHPPRVKVELLEALVARFPGGCEARAVLGTSGSDAVEIALETALLATGRVGILAFEGAYHGLSLGALDVTWRDDFRTPFRALLPDRTLFAPYGDLRETERHADATELEIGAVLVEPLQGRGGERVPPKGFLAGLRRLCDDRGWLLIADEVYTGFGRTGRWFACEHEEVVPDLLCVAKGLASGMPLSACVGRRALMDAWPASGGEALRTQTFLGHPPGCAAALASMRVLEEEKLVDRAAELGRSALTWLREATEGHPAVRECRGLGLMLGVECHEPTVAHRTCAEALRRGFILLPSGHRGEVISLTPPLVIGREALEAGLRCLVESLP